MALAERRDKQKYHYGSDPRNTFWANDSNKFGQRMMERMGWNSGDGLGKTRSGMKSHVKVKKKTTFSGIGADDNNDYNWLATQDAFSAVLNGLNAEFTNGASSGDSKEAPKPAPANQRRKLLYSRFKKSKDLASYSQDDLKSILGDEDKRPEDRKTKQESTDDSTAAETDETIGLTTVTRKESVQDYFAAKLAALKAKRNGTQPETEESTEDIKSLRKKSKKKKNKTKDESEGKAKRKASDDQDLELELKKEKKRKVEKKTDNKSKKDKSIKKKKKKSTKSK